MATVFGRDASGLVLEALTRLRRVRHPAAHLVHRGLGAIMETSMAPLERPTVVTHLGRGPVEYRLGRRGGATVVVFHGGHMRAGLAIGEEVFADRDYSVLAPSRPGYGQTPLQTGRSPSGFADVTAELCYRLGFDHVAAVVGISAGARTAVAMAARHPQLVQRLILESAVGFLPWPDRRTRVAANVVFTASTERVTWGIIRFLMRFAPAFGLWLLVGDLSTKPTNEVLASLSDEDRATLVALFSRMRSGQGFINDLRSTYAVPSEPINQPTLVIASRKDGAVPIAHAKSLVTNIPRAKLLMSEADSHFIWFGNDYPMVADEIRHFLIADPSQ